MNKRKGSLLVKFAVVFLIFTVITLTICGISMFLIQQRLQKNSYEESARHLIKHFDKIMQDEGDEFVYYQEYMLKNHDKINVPYDYDWNYLPAKEKYEALFAERYPGKLLGKDIAFDDLDEDVKQAFALYKHEFWLTVYEGSRDSFNVEYTYYIVPTGEPLHMYYLIDSLREEKEGDDGNKYIELCLDVEEPYEQHRTMWEAWDTGRTPQGYDPYDNEYGRTYAYYAPLYVNGQKMGIISIDVLISNVDKDIISATLRQMLGIAATLVVAVFILLVYIHKRYIKKIENLTGSVASYSNDKDVDVVVTIENDIKGADEISSLSMQIAAMILELDNYMKNLMRTTKELTDTKKHAKEMNELAHRDALTGIRNKTAYDNEVKKLDWQIEDGFKDFGIAMIDLNFLKRINDTYGHDKGNIAIRKLCYVVCNVFKHSPVFRIGGDEFVVIIENEDFENIDDVVMEFNRRLDEIHREPGLDQWERISAAIGYSAFDPKYDQTVANVFKRADKAMYNRKKEMKAVRMD